MAGKKGARSAPRAECMRGCGYTTSARGIREHEHACLYPYTLDRLFEYGGVDSGADDECWEWAHISGHVYGRTPLGYAHRMALIFSGKPAPDGLMALHRCGNPPCVNPAHLYWGTAANNVRDAVAHGTLDLAANGRKGGRIGGRRSRPPSSMYTPELRAKIVATRHARNLAAYEARNDKPQCIVCGTTLPYTVRKRKTCSAECARLRRSEVARGNSRARAAAD